MKQSRELTQALAAASTILERRRKIEFEIEKAISMQPAIEARLQDAMEGLGVAEADAAIDGGSAQTSSAHKMLAAARESADALSARIQGLRRRLTEQEDEIVTAHESLAALRNEFTDKCIEEYRATFLKAAESFMDVLRVGHGLSDGLGVHLPGLGYNAVHDPQSGLPMALFERAGSAESNRSYRSSRDSIAAITEQARSIEKLAEGIEKARREREVRVLTPRSQVQNIPGPYAGLSEDQWRAAQATAPRPMAHFQA